MTTKRLIAAAFAALALSAAPARPESRRIEARAKQTAANADGPQIMVSAGHLEQVNSVSYSPDGKYLASGSSDKTVKIWDAVSGRCLKTFEGHSDWVNSVSYSPDGKYLASGSSDDTVKIWDVASGRCLNTLEGHSNNINSVSYSPDGKYLASGSGDKTVKIWEAASGRCLKTLAGHSEYVSSVSYSPDGKYLASGSGDKTVKIWEAASGRCLKTLEGHAEYVRSVSYSPDGKYLASGSGDKTVKIWEAASGRCLNTLAEHSDSVISVSYSPDGKHIASSLGKWTKIWDVASGKSITVLISRDLESRIYFAPNGAYLVTEGWYGENVKIFETASGSCVKSIEEENCIRSISFAPDGKRFACAFEQKWWQNTQAWYRTYGMIKVWDTASGKQLHVFDGEFQRVDLDDTYIYGYSADNTIEVWDISGGKHIKSFDRQDQMRSVGYSPDGKYIVAANDGAVITIWDAKTLKTLRTLNGHSKWVSAIAFHPDGKRLASAAFDGTIKLWELASGRCIKTIKTEAKRITGIDYSPDGKYLIDASYDYHKVDYSDTEQRITVRDAESGIAVKSDVNEIDSYAIPNNSIRYSPDGQSFLMENSYRQLSVWKWKQTENGEYYIDKDVKIQGTAEHISFSQDGKYLASYDNDNTIKISEIASGTVVKTLDGRGALSSVCYSPDGKTLASGYRDGSIKILNAQSGAALQTFTGHCGSVYSVRYSPDGKHLVSCARYDEDIRVWDCASGACIGTLKGRNNAERARYGLFKDILYDWQYFGDKTVVAVWNTQKHKLLNTFELLKSWSFSGDKTGKHLAAGFGDGTIKIFDTASGKEIRTLAGHSSWIYSIDYSPDGRILHSSGSDQTVKFWNAETGSLLATVFNLGDGEWLCHTPEGFFSGSEWAAKNLVYILDGTETIGIDQVFTSLYRPDLVAAKLRGQDISAYADKINLASLVRSGSAPRTAFLNLPGEAPSRDLRLECSVTNTGGGIGSVNLVLNGKNILLAESVPSEGGQTFVIEHLVTLQNGENTLELYATNGADKVESLRAAQKVMWCGNVKKPNLYVLTAAVNRYRDKNLRLKHAVSDAEAISQEFAAQKKSLYQNIFTVNLFDGDVTKENLAASFQKLSAQVEADDVFVFYIAGHGTTYEDGDYYYLPSDFRYTGSESIAEGGISKNDFTKFLSLIKAGKTLILLDTCQSGAFLSTEARGGLTEKTAIDRLTRATGHATIAASSDLQDAMEGYNGHGIFTYTIVEGLSGKADADNDGFITLQELSAYTETEVPRRSYEKWGYEQIPQRDLRRQDFPIYTRQR